MSEKQIRQEIKKSKPYAIDHRYGLAYKHLNNAAEILLKDLDPDEREMFLDDIKQARESEVAGDMRPACAWLYYMLKKWVDV